MDLLGWGLLLLGAAVLLGALELLIPSAGVIGLVAVAVAFAGVACLWVHDPLWGLSGLGAVVVLGPLATWYGLKILPYTPIGRSLILGGPLEDEADQEPDEHTRALADARSSLVGRAGVALTDLRPIGVVRIDGERIDASAEMGYIPAGQRVTVVSADGIQVKVRAEARETT